VTRSSKRQVRFTGQLDRTVAKTLRDNSLTIALLAAFAASLAGMAVSGWHVQAEELRDHGQATIDLATYAMSGQFVSAVFENWESEFLQMAAFVALTALLYQRGSAESRDPDEPGGEAPHQRPGPRNLGTWLYAYSLGIVLAALFVLSFLGHLFGSFDRAAEVAALHGTEAPRLPSYLAQPQFWFESFQNWQSEFLSTAALVLLSIWLRFHGSPESKPVDAPHTATGK
jgi:hypothetical protein